MAEVGQPADPLAEHELEGLHGEQLGLDVEDLEGLGAIDGSVRRTTTAKAVGELGEGWGSSVSVPQQACQLEDGRTAPPLRVQRTDSAFVLRRASHAMPSKSVEVVGVRARRRDYETALGYKSVFHAPVGPSENVTADERGCAGTSGGIVHSLFRFVRTQEDAFVMLRDFGRDHVVVAGSSAGGDPSRRAGAAVTEKVDYDAIYKIKQEGLQQLAGDGHRELADGRLRRAAHRVAEHQEPLATGPSRSSPSQGAQNARLGDVGRRSARGWQKRAFLGDRRSTPVAWTIIGAPKAWTPGTEGLSSPPMRSTPPDDDATQDLERWKGKLKGKIVLASADPRGEGILRSARDALHRRRTSKKLEESRSAPRARRDATGRCSAFMVKRIQFLADEGVLAVFEPSRGGDGGTIFVQQGGAYSANGAVVHPLPRSIRLRRSSSRSSTTTGMARTLDKNVPVSVELNVRTRHDAATRRRSTSIAELAGADKADEVVMLGAHFDSWHSGTGRRPTTRAGSAVMLEALSDPEGRRA